MSLITGNPGKALEYSELLGIEIAAVKVDLIEIQSLDVVKVVERKAADAFDKVGGPVLVDDTGLALEAWNGMPGALVAWFLESVGTAGILQMADGVTDRAATVTTAIGYAGANGDVRVFTGMLKGELTREERGTNGFGYDSIFVADGSNETFAEMTSARKNEMSHRRLAVNALRVGLGLSD